ncbi:MAG: hypothetical protein MJZ16_04275 [Bacteroidales bacterium]|nr:hypothetical protein [Bacteroidales bacterium]
MGEFTKPLEDLSKNAAEYVDMKIEDVKLRTVKGLSVAMNKLIVALILLFVASIVLLAAALGCTLLLGDILGSYAAGAFIVSGVFLVLLIILYLFRNKMFLNSFLRMFLNLFFTDDEEIK